jgi:hypothetical protein
LDGNIPTTSPRIKNKFGISPGNCLLPVNAAGHRLNPNKSIARQGTQKIFYFEII